MNLKGGRPKETYSRCVSVGEIYESRSYGKFEIIEYKSSRDVLVRFLDTGFETRVQSSAAKIGNVRDRLIPTHYGVGIFDNDRQDIDNDTYKIWTDMLRRCYAYKDRRESCLKSLAEKWKGKMDERAYNALLNYEVKITD